MSRSTMKSFTLLAGPAGVLVLAVTQGLLDQLAPGEIRGVLTHEIAQIANRDIFIGAVTAFMATGIGSVAAMAAFNAKPGRGGGDDSPGRAAAQSSRYIIDINPLAGQAAPLAALFRVPPPAAARVARLPHTPVRAR